MGQDQQDDEQKERKQLEEQVQLEKFYEKEAVLVIGGGYGRTTGP